MEESNFKCICDNTSNIHTAIMSFVTYESELYCWKCSKPENHISYDDFNNILIKDPETRYLKDKSGLTPLDLVKTLIRNYTDVINCPYVKFRNRRYYDYLINELSEIKSLLEQEI